MEWLNYGAAIAMAGVLDKYALTHPWFASFVAFTLVVNVVAWLLSIERATKQ